MRDHTTGPVISVEIGLILPDGEITGTLRVDHGAAHVWSAMPARHTDFVHAARDLDLADRRPWAAEDTPGHGYEIDLPPVFDNADPTLRQRAALALEECIYLGRSGQLTGTYHRQLDLTEPAWPLNVPRVI